MSLHQQLLDRLDAVAGPPSYPRLGAALRAVVELHQPVQNGQAPSRYFTCSGCDNGSYALDSPDWPCSTVQAVARELGIEAP